ncbi:ATP-binding protein [Candidatus Margulisiibacteriota bacterium]
MQKKIIFSTKEQRETINDIEINKLIFENSRHGILVTDFDGLIEKVNPAFIKMWVFSSPDEIINKIQFIDLWEDPDDKVLIQLFEDWQCSEKDLIAKRKDGTKFHIRLTSNMMPKDSKKPKKILMLCEDVTDEKELEAAFFHASKLAALGEMAAGMAHELFTPLAALRSLCQNCEFSINKITELIDEIVPEKNESDPKIDELEQHSNRTIDYSKMFISLVDKATKIVREARNFSTKTSPFFRNIQINDIINNTLNLYIDTFKSTGININLNLNKNLPLTKGDPDQLEQVLVNIINNAKWALETSTTKNITIETSIQNYNIKISISDTGIGISQDIVDNLFVPFFSTKESLYNDSSHQYLGLGLSICYRIIKAHNGKIKAFSEPGKGSTFEITLPIAQTENDHSPAN